MFSNLLRQRRKVTHNCLWQKTYKSEILLANSTSNLNTRNFNNVCTYHFRNFITLSVSYQAQLLNRQTPVIHSHVWKTQWKLLDKAFKPSVRLPLQYWFEYTWIIRNSYRKGFTSLQIFRQGLFSKDELGFLWKSDFPPFGDEPGGNQGRHLFFAGSIFTTLKFKV